MGQDRKNIDGQTHCCNILACIQVVNFYTRFSRYCMGICKSMGLLDEKNAK